MQRSGRGGFTLTELCVVAIVLILIACLLLPLLGRVRDVTFHRNACINNQSQIAMAMLLHAFDKRKMPPAMSWSTDPSDATHPRRPISWAQALFAELGRSDLAQIAGKMTAADAVRVSLLVCPADHAKAGAKGGPLSYAVNGGSFKHWHADGSFDSIDRGAWPYQAGEKETARPATFEDLGRGKKGTAFTIALGENVDARSYIPTSDRADYEVSLLWDPSAPLGFNQDAGKGRLDDAHARPSSFHSGGAVVAFCDGHVAFISDSIDYRLYATLMATDAFDAAESGKTMAQANGLAGFFVWPLDESMIPTQR